MANPPPHFIVFVPGYMGSRLRSRSTGKLVWVDIPSLLRRPFAIPDALTDLFDQMRYPNDDIFPDGILDEVVFLPPLFKQEQYGRMLEALERMGYDTSGGHPSDRNSVYTFAYDWRQDNRISGRQLGDFVKEKQALHSGAKAILIGHSNGGIVSRWYIEKEGGKDHVSRLFLMGSPWDGAPKAFQVLQDGFDVFLMRIFDRSDGSLQDKIRTAILSFPSFYQLIPAVSPFLHSSSGQMLDPFGELHWLAEVSQRKMLLDGRRFNQELGTNLSVDTLCFFGVKTLTTTGGRVSVGARGIWSGFEWERTAEGDGTVPVQSAIHPNAHQKLPFTASHGDIYIVPPVLDKLEFELVTKYRLGVLAQAVTRNLTIHFEPNRNDYSPGEPILVWATVNRRQDSSPVFGAVIDVSLKFHQPLPGFFEPDSTQETETVTLSESTLEAGHYEGSLTAPQDSGYYRLLATVRVTNEEPEPLEELILVEAEPDWRVDSVETADVGGEPGPSDPGPIPTTSPPGDTTAASWTVPPTAGGVFRSWDEPQTSASGSEAPGTAAEPPAPTAVGLQPSGSSDAVSPRYLVAELTDGDLNKPLPVNIESTLALWIDETQRTFGSPFLEGGVFSEGEETVRLQMILSSPDFTVLTRTPQELRVPRRGRSRNKARFDIEPQRPGRGRASAYLYRENHFIQGLDFELNAAEEPQISAHRAEGLAAPQTGLPAISSVTPLGRPADHLGTLQPRDVLLIIKNRGDAFDLTLVDEAVTEARLPLTLFQLNGIIGRARQALLDVVYLARDPSGIHVFRGTRPPANITLAYQAGLDIPADIAQAALQRLAEEGLLLYQDLFFSPAAGLEVRQIGDRLRSMAQTSRLKLQIVSQNFFLPWGMIYLGDDVRSPDPELFLGMRHIIEHLPLQASPPLYDPAISSLPHLNLSLNVDPSIDQAMGADFVGRQVNFWQNLDANQAVKLTLRSSGDEWLKAMQEPASDQFFYFYGHAITPDASDPVGPDGASLSFGERSRVSLRDLRLHDRLNNRFPGAPLIFINACESAELSPWFYSGFMPYFTAKGARGMIGTECEAPAVFAAEWAQRFFERFFFQEQPIGQIFLEMRREFAHQHNNILGLLYALYCDGDTRVSPPLKRP